MIIRKILVPTDFSSFSDAALRYATSIAKDSGAMISIVHCEEPEDAFANTGFGGYPTGDDVEALRDKLRLVIPPSADVGYSHHLLHGQPAKAIVKFAEREDIDLVVLCTHGRRGLPRLLMGSVAEDIVRHARCPVLSIKRPAGVGAVAASAVAVGA